MAQEAQAMNSGTCNGGPLDGKLLHHPEPVYQVATEPHWSTRRPVPGMVASADPAIKFGTYRFGHGFWVWQE
jgi:hypothetical protein